MTIPFERKYGLATIILALLCCYQLDAYAGDQEDLSRESEAQYTERLRVRAEAADKREAAAEAAFAPVGEAAPAAPEVSADAA